MKRNFLNTACSILLVVLYVSATLAGEYLHSHPALGVGGIPSITSHDCGDREVHKPLGDLQLCLVCHRATQPQETPSVSVIAALFATTPFYSVLIAAPASASKVRQPADRAPPALLS